MANAAVQTASAAWPPAGNRSRRRGAIGQRCKSVISVPLPGIPARLTEWCSMAGLLAHGYAPFICLPGIAQWHGALRRPRMSGNPLTVAGAATASIPCRGLTVFPINPLRVTVGEPSRPAKRQADLTSRSAAAARRPVGDRDDPLSGSLHTLCNNVTFKRTIAGCPDAVSTEGPPPCPDARTGPIERQHDGQRQAAMALAEARSPLMRRSIFIKAEWRSIAGLSPRMIWGLTIRPGSLSRRSGDCRSADGCFRGACGSGRRSL